MRLKGLRRHLHNGALQAEIGGWDGVLSVAGNPATGSLLIHYDDARVRPADMESRVERHIETLQGFVQPPSPSPAPRQEVDFSLWQINRYAKFGMLGSLTASLLALAVAKRAHAAAGALYLAFLALHLANHRQKLLK